jgi:lysophospholipase L1-like esterase
MQAMPRLSRVELAAAVLLLAAPVIHVANAAEESRPVDPISNLPINPAEGGAPVNPALPTLFIAGDSTAAPGPRPEQQGWAEPLASYFDLTKITVANRARGGRSSRTFITEGHWEKMLAQVKRGDYVLIQFGHNDSGALNEEPPGSTRPLRARGTIRGTGPEVIEVDNVLTKKHEVVHTFGWYLRQMISDTRAKGATPVLLSLTARDVWKDGRVECGSGDYRELDAEVAAAEHVQFIDLSRILADQYQTKGPDVVQTFFTIDHLHTNPLGADFNAHAVVSGLKTLKGDPFKAWLSPKGRAVAPDKGWRHGSVCERIR